MRIELEVNGAPVALDLPGEMPLLWALRDHLGLTGTRYGCGRGLCGACTVHLDGAAVRACQLPLAGVDGRHVTTIEGLDSEGEHPLQRAWREHRVAQCGYCQSGQIMAAAALLAAEPDAGDERIDAVMNGNLCRCGTYGRIRAAVRSAAAAIAGDSRNARSPRATRAAARLR